MSSRFLHSAHVSATPCLCVRRQVPRGLAPASLLQRPADHRSPPPVHGCPCAARRVYRCAPPLSVFRAEAPPSHAFLAAEMKQVLTGSDDLDRKLDSAAFRIQFSTSIMTLVPRASAIRLAASACEENSHDYQANPHQFGIRSENAGQRGDGGARPLRKDRHRDRRLLRSWPGNHEGAGLRGRAGHRYGAQTGCGKGGAARARRSRGAGARPGRVGQRASVRRGLLRLAPSCRYRHQQRRCDGLSRDPRRPGLGSAVRDQSPWPLRPGEPLVAVARG